MKEITYTPRNKEHFQKLLSFMGILKNVCGQVNIEPIVYGSLAYAFYTQDQTIEINDIDFLVPESAFRDILTAARDYPDITYEHTTYHSLKIFRDGVKISFDALEVYWHDLPFEFVEGRINGYGVKLVSKSALKEVYKRGAETILVKKEPYTAKATKLDEC